MTWRRRYCCGSAWGSSRVLTMGRLRVVSRPTSSSKKSARCEIWKPWWPDDDLSGDEPGQQVAHERGERQLPVHRVVLVTAVAVALAVGVVLVDDDLLPVGQDPARGLHRAGEDALARLVGDEQLERVGALGRGVLGVRVVDVVAGAVGEHGVDEVGLDVGRLRAVAGVAAGVAAGRLVVEVPADPAVLDVAVDQHRRGQDRVGIGRAAQHDAVFSLDPADLGDGHSPSLTPAPVAPGRQTDPFIGSSHDRQG
jgi:hypothetical protein